MTVHISPLMRKIMNDPVACQQLMAALDPFYDDKSERPTVVFEGKIYEIKTSGGVATQKGPNV
jgi:hypothetical protein